MSVLEPAPADSWSQSKVPIAKRVEPRLGLLNGIDNHISSAGGLRRIVQACIEHPVVALNSSFIKVHVV